MTVGLQYHGYDSELAVGGKGSGFRQSTDARFCEQCRLDVTQRPLLPSPNLNVSIGIIVSMRPKFTLRESPELLFT